MLLYAKYFVLQMEHFICSASGTICGQIDRKMYCMRNMVGKRVKEVRLRQQPKMTQAQLAAKLQLDQWDIDRAGVAKIEIGIRQVTDIELVKLAKALDVSAAWLLGEI